VYIDDLPTPALIVEANALEHNLGLMAGLYPGPRLRPHVKAHKCSALAKVQQRFGHTGFTCATPREISGLVRAGIEADFLLANESLDTARLGAIAGANPTVAVDSDETIHAAHRAGIRNVLIDVFVGLPRCGCEPDDAARLADLARSLKMNVRGVMGYEGHLMMVAPPADKRAQVTVAMETLLACATKVGGDVISAGGTGTYREHLESGVTELQAGSYAVMDTQYAALGFPFQQAAHVVGTVISRSAGWAVADVGLKALGMDHGNPEVDGYDVWFCSDEHLTFAVKRDAASLPVPAPTVLPRIGDKVLVAPAHIDPTMSQHERIYVHREGLVVDEWAIDLRHW
jgi:D-serine deaminase-like pyridoxal phosphate-dependent protein